MKYTCELCVKEFQAAPSQKARFCGRACYDKSREGHYRCHNCGKEFRDFKCRDYKFCSNKCSSDFHSGSNHYRWNGGRNIDGKGYAIIYLPEHPRAHNNQVLEHRLVMEQHLGRYLEPSEIVHHRNGNKIDNRLSNLVIHTRASHAKLHNPRLGTGKS